MTETQPKPLSVFSPLSEAEIADERTFLDEELYPLYSSLQDGERKRLLGSIYRRDKSYLATIDTLRAKQRLTEVDAVMLSSLKNCGQMSQTEAWLVDIITRLTSTCSETPNNSDEPEDIDDLVWICPECRSDDTEEIYHEDDLSSRKCNNCGFCGDPGEEFPVVKVSKSEEKIDTNMGRVDGVDMKGLTGAQVRGLVEWLKTQRRTHGQGQYLNGVGDAVKSFESTLESMGVEVGE